MSPSTDTYKKQGAKKVNFTASIWASPQKFYFDEHDWSDFFCNLNSPKTSLARQTTKEQNSLAKLQNSLALGYQKWLSLHAEREGS